VVFAFVAVALIFTQVIPGPRTAVDYLVIGTASTFAAMVTLFILLLKTWVKAPDVFYSKRRRS